MFKCPKCDGKLIVIGEEIIFDDNYNMISVYIYTCHPCRYVMKTLRKPQQEDRFIESDREKVVFT